MKTANPWSEQNKAVSSLSLRRAMRSLSKAQSDAILYCEILGFTQREAATILHVDHSAVSLRLSSARAALKKLLA